MTINWLPAHEDGELDRLDAERRARAAAEFELHRLAAALSRTAPLPASAVPGAARRGA